MKANRQTLLTNASALILSSAMALFPLGAQEEYIYDGSEIVMPADLKGEEIAQMTSPPHVPPPITRTHPTKVIVKMEVVEKVMRMADGVDYTFWTFGGTVPGSFLRVREGDVVEFELMNHPDNKMPHNIDLHAVNGPGGGAEASFTAPGRSTTFSFQVLNPGIYVYHCAVAPVGMHVANGMYGLIYVEPKEGGLEKVDHEFYIMQGDFYTKGRYGSQGLQPFSMEKAIDEKPDYVIFNGSVGALLDDNALKVKKGETVRLFFGNGGPNLISSFHAIGEIFDRVHIEGGTLINENVQTTLVAAGGAMIAEFKVDVPGNIILVDHSLTRAFNKGALGMIKVEGEPDPLVYSGKRSDKIYLPEGGTPQSMPDEGKPALAATNKAQRIEFGKNVYSNNCLACHQPEGQGIVGAFPPLAASDYLNADVNRAISTVIHGLSGEIKVNGETYNSVMPAMALNDEDIANVLTYVYNTWDNNGTEVTPKDVAAIRAADAKK